MVNIHDLTQAIVAISSALGTFVLIATGHLDAETGYLFLGGLLGGLGLGYANGRKAA